MGDFRRTQTRLCDESDKSKLRSDQLQKQVMDLNSKIVDFQSRSMRENLLFFACFGLAEHRGQGRENVNASISSRISAKPTWDSKGSEIL